MQNYSQKPYKKNIYEINLIPLLDVLLILVLLLIATSSTMQNIEIDLPYANKSKAINSNDSPILIEVLQLKHYNLIINNIRKEKISYEQMISIIKFILSNNPNTIFLIGGDKNLLYKEIIKILSTLHNMGVKSVGLMTKNYVQ